MAKLTMIKAITAALDEALKSDEKVLIFGEDVGQNGGVFRATEGLQAKYGEERVFDTPLAESGIAGLATGLAFQGFRPVPEIQFFGFLFEAMDEVAGQISRERFRMGGTRKMPITIRAPFGGGVHTPELHSDSLEGLVAQTPGLKVVIPSDPYDAKGLLISAIQSDDPVVFLEHMKLYRTLKQEVPEGSYTVPLDQAAIKREGQDISIITYGYMVQESLKAAQELEKQGINVEVLDLRSVSPLDEAAILKTVEKTGRVVLVQEAQRQAGINAQVAALIAEKAILNLQAPIGRVDAPDTPYPFSEAETLWLPNKKDIVAKVQEIMNF
ncbi:alpha-ketoacid dehydrogenase subunit beta [Ligilactobacillus ceti]|uniref:Pyruvate dehydrogenase E1 component beta subunit n=1 Tax=Ligilactobacillus ceti DSM 22408 TaxID=1122146 RepID=A0A0R2KJ49_9LACO|nr:alpha-ketoacid dehydrogenase subunit beta [Ligilactobacillus ceti]KRN89385.1 pyruvate dehydrogenase E1 component beta subunit [Ligilactobacillus ceti DSM 22408]